MKDTSSVPAPDESSTAVPASPDAPAALAGPLAAPTDTLAAEQTATPARGWRSWRRWLVAAGLAGLVLVAWAGAAVATRQHVFAGSSVSGVEVGGMSPAQARDAVATVLGDQLAQPVTLVAGEASDEMVPADSGVSVDAAASVERLTGWTLNPSTLVRRLTGTQVDAVTVVDRDALTAALDSRLDALATGTVDAQVTLEGTTPQLTPAQEGTGLDVPAAVAQLAGAWPWGEQTVSLPIGAAEPAVTDEEAHRLIDTVLTPLLSAPVTVTVEGTDAAADASATETALSPEQLAGATAIQAEGSRLEAQLDGQALRAAVLEALGAGVEVTASSSGYTIGGDPSDAPVFHEATTGREIDSDALAAEVLHAGTAQGTGERRVRLPLTQTEPEHAETAEELGVSEVVGEYATPFYYDPVRTQNLRAGTAAINGTLVRAGETFSLEEALGPVDAAHGFAASGVITNGQHTEAMGGGLSQVATTTFNAGFEAGMDDVEHHPHSVWFTRYPAGREATLWTGNLDVKWRNSTPYAALVQAWVGGGQVHVRVWSTPYYQVSITSSDRTSIRPVQVRTSSARGCEPYGGGEAGFDITVTRTRTTPDGTTLPDDVLTTSYQADDALRCTSASSGS